MYNKPMKNYLKKYFLNEPLNKYLENKLKEFLENIF